MCVYHYAMYLGCAPSPDLQALLFTADSVVFIIITVIDG